MVGGSTRLTIINHYFHIIYINHYELNKWGFVTLGFSWRFGPQHMGIVRGCCEVYPLVKLQKKLWKITILIGKSTISMAIFNSYVTNCQRVCFVCICADRQDQNSTSLLGCPRTA